MGHKLQANTVVARTPEIGALLIYIINNHCRSRYTKIFTFHFANRKMFEKLGYTVRPFGSLILKLGISPVKVEVIFVTFKPAYEGFS